MYTAKVKGDKRIIEGSYIPNAGTCECKACKFTIEVPKDTSDQDINDLVEKIKWL